MQLLSLSAITLLASFVAATSEVITGQWTCVDAGAYQLCQNLWGEDNGVGSQNATLYSATGDSISWSTTYTWADGPYDVKSYSNVNQLSATGMLLSEITSAPTAWQWEYEAISSSTVADVSYDIWVGTSPDDPGTDTSTFEIGRVSILSLFGYPMSGRRLDFDSAGPLGSEIASDISVGGYSWNLYSGFNTYWTTVSFVTNQGNIYDFSSDLKDFFGKPSIPVLSPVSLSNPLLYRPVYLNENSNVSLSNYLQSVESGTEPFLGTATLYTESFSVTVNT
ncbi:uncharacterized protein FIBRA_08561 [Fibroporia radiculosa]|uniref:Uncharacterized protein n=1 Tax=Fibroporia radiculosa TaxID=599839 RepID=J4GX14_9APHY|nr:uncharacterized protein FIBRA_08561 [Fibroporia radiculosa]CCM06310.1 predicted protein [Fibroporia radiculosa]